MTSPDIDNQPDYLSSNSEGQPDASFHVVPARTAAAFARHIRVFLPVPPARVGRFVPVRRSGSCEDRQAPVRFQVRDDGATSPWPKDTCLHPANASGWSRHFFRLIGIRVFAGIIRRNPSTFSRKCFHPLAFACCRGVYATAAPRPAAFSWPPVAAGRSVRSARDCRRSAASVHDALRDRPAA